MVIQMCACRFVGLRWLRVERYICKLVELGSLNGRIICDDFQNWKYFVVSLNPKKLLASEKSEY